MPDKKLSEFSCKKIYYKSYQILQINENNNLNDVLEKNTWLETSALVCKVDNGEKRRGKKGLITINKDMSFIKQWILIMKEKGYNKFIIEKFQHIKKELYVSFHSDIKGDFILFSENGGINVGNVEDSSTKLYITNSTFNQLSQTFNLDLSLELNKLYQFYKNYYLTLLEINPLIINTDNELIAMDFAAQIDETAEFLIKDDRLDFNYDNKKISKQEQNIKLLDSKSGASLKFTLLNPDGRIWTLIAGGGASVLYTDTIINLGYGEELGNYGEYSGAPNEDFMYEYTINILELILASSAKNKIIFIGGAIANFTRVDITFAGMIKGLQKFTKELSQQNIKIFVRRGGPFFEIGLKNMSNCCEEIGIECKIHGPEKFITDIVLDGLDQNLLDKSSINFKYEYQNIEFPRFENYKNFNFARNTHLFIWGLHKNLAQRILDFDYCCKKNNPSIKAIIDPTRSKKGSINLFWNTKEILIPIYNNLNDATLDNPSVDTLINLASFRSAYQVSLEAIVNKNINKILVIAEGIPERWAIDLNQKARLNNKLIIGPSSVGLITPGIFRGGNTGGTIDNIINSNLFTSGSIAILTKSGGLLNEMCNIVSNCNGDIYEALSIGGDRFPSSNFIDHILRYEMNEKVKLIIVLGEIGGNQEIILANAKKNKEITKPIIAWCIGTSSNFFNNNIQFGHAGASANNEIESSLYKNFYMKESGILVPESFEGIKKLIKNTMNEINFTINIRQDYNNVAKDFDDLYKNKLIRKSSTINSSISSDTNKELFYNNKAISDIISNNSGIGGIIGHLWFKKELPKNVTKFFELILSICADHGPAVSGAHNTIITARAGKDLVSSLCSGLLTIGPKFGGAIKDATIDFYEAFGKLSPQEFINKKKKKWCINYGNRS